ncbi:hypothetical protein PV326_000144 [Microctonus aethiopoides]|nr:hypothetical protein PV326_000144 [Microctonus aethiopoides]
MWMMDRILTFTDIKIVAVLLHDDFFISSMRKKRANIVRSNRKSIEKMENSWDTQWTSKNSCDDLSITDTETIKDENNTSIGSNPFL